MKHAIKYDDLVGKLVKVNHSSLDLGGLTVKILGKRIVDGFEVYDVLEVDSSKPKADLIKTFIFEEEIEYE